MINVFCIFQRRLLNEGITEHWTYRVFHAESLSEFKTIKLEGLADPYSRYYEEDEDSMPALEWYANYQRYISDKPIYQGDAPSYEMVTEILRQKYHLNVIKYIY